MANWKYSLQLENSSGVPVTGQASNLQLRTTPYGSGEAIAGLTVTEIGTQGNYVFSGFGAYYQDVKVFLSGTEQTAFGIFDAGDPDDRYVNKVDAQTVAGIKTFSVPIVSSTAATNADQVPRYDQVVKLTTDQTVAGVKTFSSAPKSSTAAVATTELVRFDEAILTTGTQTKTGQLIFDTTGSIVPTVTNPYTAGRPTATGHLTNKAYVDTLFGTAQSMAQSTYVTKLVPTRATEDRFSHTTMELCNAYLAGLTDIATFRGSIIVESLGLAGNIINVDDGVSDWVSAGVDIVGIGRPQINRRGFNDSLTVDSKILNCYIVDSNATSTRTYVNFTFQDCDFYSNNTDLTFNNCTFLGTNRARVTGGALNITNCKGTSLWYNDDITTTITSGTSQPVDTRPVATANLGL